MFSGHRKHRKTYNEPGHAHYLTYSCVNRWPLLSKDRACRWVLDAIETARQRHGFDVHAFVIMPEHVHLLVRPRSTAYGVERFLYDLKRPVSWQAKAWLTETGNKGWLRRLTFAHGNRQVFRFWLPGGGFDRNIFREMSLGEVAGYIHENPVRRGLVKDLTDWPWSSARFWAGLDNGPLGMDPIPTQ